MNILLALVAFSVVMIVMSTIVTAFVQILHRARSIRERHLKFFLRAYFDDVLWPRFQAEISALNSFDGNPRILAAEAQTGVARLYTAILRLYRMAKTRKLGGVFWLGLVIGGLIVMWISFSLDPTLGVILAAIGSYIGLATHLTAKERVLVTSNREDIREKFVRTMTATVGTAQEGSGKAETIDALEFASRLAETDVGRAVAGRGDNNMEALITDLVRRFDFHGQGASAGFRRLSQRYAVRIAFVVAFVANVDAVNVLQHFIDNPNVAERVAAMGPKVVESHEKAVAALEHERDKITSELNNLNNNDPQKNKAQRENLEQELTELSHVLESTKKEFLAQISGLAEAGVPIGWKKYPYCVVNGYPTDPRCRDLLRRGGDSDWKLPLQGQGTTNDDVFARILGFEIIARFAGEIQQGWKWTTDRFAPIAQFAGAVEGTWDWIADRLTANTGDFLGWLAGVIIAGALIGLGGPFWFDFYQRLSAITQLAKSFGLKAKPKEDAAAPTPATDSQRLPEEIHKPVSAVDAFKKAVEANKIYEETEPAIRRPLAPDGSAERP